MSSAIGGGTWNPTCQALSQQLSVPDGRTFEQVLELLSISNTADGENGVNCYGGAGATNCCPAQLNNNNPGPIAGGSSNCAASCLCCVAAGLQQAGAAVSDINTYISCVEVNGCIGTAGQSDCNISSTSECFDGSTNAKSVKGAKCANIAIPSSTNCNSLQFKYYFLLVQYRWYIIGLLALAVLAGLGMAIVKLYTS